MHSTPFTSAAPAAHGEFLAPSAPGRRPRAALGRVVAAVLLVASAIAARPAAAEEPARRREPAVRGGGALLFLAFLVPLPVTMALASPPRDAGAPPSRDAAPSVARRDPEPPTAHRDARK